MNVLIDIVQDNEGLEWARIVTEEAARPLFRLRRAESSLLLQIKPRDGAPREYALPEGTSSSAEAFARLFAQSIGPAG